MKDRFYVTVLLVKEGVCLTGKIDKMKKRGGKKKEADPSEEEGFSGRSSGDELVVLAAKQRIESIRRILSSEGAKEFTEVSRLRMQDLETALKRFILNILTTTTYKEESEGAILEKLIRAACKPQASPQGKQ